jgi:flagellar biosynthesis protein FlhB
VIPSHLITKLQFDAQAFYPSLSHPHPSSEVNRLFRVVQALPISCILLAAEIGRFFTEDLKLLLHYHQSINQASNQSSKQASNQTSEQFIDHLFCCVKKICAKFALMDD